jgi:hypothetical protein
MGYGARFVSKQVQTFPRNFLRLSLLSGKFRGHLYQVRIYRPSDMGFLDNPDPEDGGNRLNRNIGKYSIAPLLQLQISHSIL